MFNKAIRDGRTFLWTFVFTLARSSIFPSRSAFLYDIVFAFPYATHRMRAVCVWTDQVGRVNSPPRHYPPPPPSSRVRGVCVYWREAGLSSYSCFVHHPPLPPLLSVHIITVSSLHRNANLAFLFFRVPSSCVPV